MKKLISVLASIPFSILAQQFPEAPMCFYVLKNAVTAFIGNGNYTTLLAMDLKTHACGFSCEQSIKITKVGYRAWKPGINYRISLWRPDCDLPIASCLVTPEDTEAIQFFTLKRPVSIHPDSSYFISRTYVSGGPNCDVTDYIGWLGNNKGEAVCPLKQNVIVLSNGFFSNDMNPFRSEHVSNITTRALLPLLDFEYTINE